MGHDIGDQLLIEVSKRLVNTLHKGDIVARIGGDEFIILVQDIEDMNYIDIESKKVLNCLNKPFTLNNQDFFITTSIGVAIYPNDGEDAGLPLIRIGVNLSAKQFQNGNLVSDVEGILRETGLDCKYLEMEITESAAMKGKGNIIETLSVFKKMGIQIAIDDFGTEYSSLNYLKQLPVYEVEKLLKKGRF